MKKIMMMVLVCGLFCSSVESQTKIPQKSQKAGHYSTAPSINSSGMNFAKKSSEKTILTRNELTRIKAVLVAGPVEDSSPEFVEKVRTVATWLRGIGVTVFEFYNEKANWRDIVTISRDANIFLYCGHGTTRGDNDTPGGLCLANDRIVSSDEIVKELKLHKNALILFHTVCMGAGSSAGDKKDIGAIEAMNRVSCYAKPFVKNGAGGYYANNYYGSMVDFLEKFFKGKSIRDIYVEEVSGWNKIELTEKYRFDPRFEASVSGKNASGDSCTVITITNGIKTIERMASVKSYDIAYVGLPGFIVSDLVK